MNLKKNRKGFTLIEVMLAMSISLVVLGAVFITYNSQSKSYVAQEQVAEMQQNLRAGMFVLSRELRMAGYNENVKTESGVQDTNTDGLDNDCDGLVDDVGGETLGIQEARSDFIRFSMDLFDGNDNDGDGQTDEADEAGIVDGDCCESGEEIAYSLYVNAKGVQCLGRTLYFGDPASRGSIKWPVAEHIEALNFVYLDQDGAVLDDGGGSVTASIGDIRSVQVSMVARSRKQEGDVVNKNTYRNLQDDLVYSAKGDHFRRLGLNLEIRCRNLGIYEKLTGGAGGAGAGG